LQEYIQQAKGETGQNHATSKRKRDLRHYQAELRYLEKAYAEGIHPRHELTISLEKVPLHLNKNFFTSTTETKEGIWYLSFDRGWQMSIELMKLRDFTETLHSNFN